MWVGIREMERLIELRWPGLAVGGSVAGALWLLGLRMHLRAGRRRGERRMEEELTAYARLDVRMPANGSAVELARRVSQLMAEKSAFRRAAMLVRDTEGRLVVAASAGMDDSTVQSLNAWGEGVAAAERGGGADARRGDGGMGVRVGGKSFAVVLGKRPAEIGYRRAVVTPLWATGGRMLGALAVGADSLMSARRSALVKALGPLEALAFKVERAMENAATAERLLHAEKLAGLGLLAGGMAHALNNPLTAVLGFAELIADTTGEERVKEDAAIIVREALRMRQTVETLLEFWRPGAQGEGTVDVTALVRELAEACAEKLESIGVRLVIQAGDESAAVRGDRDRLRQMVEHLLNNAAQALLVMEAVKDDEERVIRVSVGQDGRMVHLIVSDTGPGFREPGRVFALDDTVRGAGLGLSVCYGIVQEHRGEISAFNLHPHGAAVAVELPLVDLDIKNSEMGAGQRTYSVSV
jgi:signal transduction histidine kinase